MKYVFLFTLPLAIHVFGNFSHAYSKQECLDTWNNRNSISIEFKKLDEQGVLTPAVQKAVTEKVNRFFVEKCTDDLKFLAMLPNSKSKNSISEQKSDHGRLTTLRPL